MTTFNAFGSSEKNYGKTSKPVWLGTVAPHAVGGVFASAAMIAGAHYAAGTPVKLAEGVITPLIGFKVVAFSAAAGSETVDTITILPASFGGAKVIPAADDVLQALGATFAAGGKAAVVASVTALTGDDAGKYQITVLHSANLGNLTAGDILVYSASDAAGSNKAVKDIPNGYLYNDVYIGDLASPKATGAVVDFHGEGLIVDFTPAYPIKAQMKAAVPNVVQVEFPDDAFVTVE